MTRRRTREYRTPQPCPSWRLPGRRAGAVPTKTHTGRARAEAKVRRWSVRDVPMRDTHLVLATLLARAAGDISDGAARVHDDGEGFGWGAQADRGEKIPAR